MRCVSCNMQIEKNRPGRYCKRCADLHCVYGWEIVKKIRAREERAKREQTTLCPCDCPDCG